MALGPMVNVKGRVGYRICGVWMGGGSSSLFRFCVKRVQIVSGQKFACAMLKQGDGSWPGLVVP